MIEWRGVPWPLWLYSAITLLGTILIEIEAHGPIGAKALYPFFMLGWLYFLVKGVRWVWVVTVGIYVLGLIRYFAWGPLKWQGVAFAFVGLLLLLLPATRRYFSRQTAAVGT
jgi:hypothetical protein